MSNVNPYAATNRAGHANSSSDPAQADKTYPIEFRRGSMHGLALAACTVGGVLSILFAMLMFLCHLFVFPGNTDTLTLHSTTTFPMLIGIFAFVNAYHLAKTPSCVRLWLRGIEIEAKQPVKFTWDQIDRLSVDDVIGGQRKKIRLMGEDGKAFYTISGGLTNFDQLIQEMKVAVRPADAPATPIKADEVHQKRGRLRAVGFGAFGVLMMLASGFILYEGRWQQYRSGQMASRSVQGQAEVVDRKVAPNGVTKRLYVKVSGNDGTEETHNMEVEDWLYESSSVGDEVDVQYVPDDPRIAELVQGQVLETDLLKSPAGSYVLGSLAALMTVFIFATAALSWKGYDLKWENGSFKRVPIGE